MDIWPYLKSGFCEGGRGMYGVDKFLGMEGGREEVEGDHDISIKQKRGKPSAEIETNQLNQRVQKCCKNME